MQLQLIRIHAIPRPGMSHDNTIPEWAEHPAGAEIGGRLLIRTLRRIAAGRECEALTIREFDDAFGEDAAEVFATFYTFLQAVACGSRRKMRVAHPGSHPLTPDELQLLTVIAAAQSGDAPRLEAHLRWLSRASLRAAVAITARALATALAVHDYWLPLYPAIVTGVGENASAETAHSC
jgi:hypothetical protein